MNPESGYEGSSSFGDTRLFHHTPNFDMKNEMLEDSLEMWKEVENKSGKKIVHNSEILVFGDKNSRMIKDGVNELPAEQILTSEQITERYSAFENLPDNYAGFVTDKAGILKAKVALEAYKSLCEEKGVELKYNTKIADVSKNEVKTEDGTIYSADNVVGKYLSPESILLHF